MDKKNNIELEVAKALAQEPFIITIGEKELLFNKLSLAEREKISAHASLLPLIDIDLSDENTKKLSDAILAMKYSRTLAEIITIAAKVKSDWRYFKKLNIWFKKRNIFKAIYNEPMTIFELYDIYKRIAVQIGPAFFLDIIISLKGQNHLKPTKET